LFYHTYVKTALFIICSIVLVIICEISMHIKPSITNFRTDPSTYVILTFDRQLISEKNFRTSVKSVVLELWQIVLSRQKQRILAPTTAVEVSLKT